MCPIDELVDKDERAWRQLRPERTASGERYQIRDPDPFEHIDIRTVVDVRRRKAMAAIVTRQEHHRAARDIAGKDLRRWFTPRARDALLAHIREPGQVIDA